MIKASLAKDSCGFIIVQDSCTGGTRLLYCQYKGSVLAVQSTCTTTIASLLPFCRTSIRIHSYGTRWRYTAVPRV